LRATVIDKSHGNMGDSGSEQEGLSRRQRAAALLVPLVLTALAYANSLHAEFEFDDYKSVVRHPAVRDISRISLSSFSPALTGQRPVTVLTFALNRRWAGLDVVPYHLTNLALHLLTVSLVYAFTRSTLRRAGYLRPTGMALAITGLFALHPLHSEAVTYIVQRGECLASLLYLAALLLLLRAEERGFTLRGVAASCGAFIAFALGVGSKLVAITMPAAYLLHAAWFDRGGDGVSRRSWARRRALAAPFLIAAGATGFLFLSVLTGSRSAGFQVAPGPWRYFLTELRAIVTYLRLLAWPAGQSIDHTFPWSSGFDVRTALSAVAVAVLLAGAVALRALAARKASREGAPGRVASFGVLWFFLLLAPTSTIVPLVDPLVEHRTYLASWGVLTAAVVGADVALRRIAGVRAARFGAALTAVTWAALALALHFRNEVWRTQESLWRDVVSQYPDAFRPHVNLASGLREIGRGEEAVAELRQALVLAPQDASKVSEIEGHLGDTLARLGRVEEARTVLERAAARTPDDARLLSMLAVCLIEFGELDRATSLARRAVDLEPWDPGHVADLASVMWERGERVMALAMLRKAVRLEPDGIPWLRDLGIAETEMGRVAEACDTWRRLATVARDGPDGAAARERLAELRCGIR